jgi:hypothetical protein
VSETTWTLAWFVWEAWPSRAIGVTLTAGWLGAAKLLAFTCESERLVVFADGVESDRLEVAGGSRSPCRSPRAGCT